MLFRSVSQSRYGQRDRVAQAIIAGNTQNSLMRYPAMSAYMSGYEVATDKIKGYGIPNTSTRLRYGGTYQDDLETMVHQQAVPMYLTFTLTIMSTNLDDKFQILEQIVALFSRNMQVSIQTHTSAIEPGTIASIEMQLVSNETQFPSGAERRMLQHTLEFRVLAYVTGPTEFNDNVIKSIKMRIAAISQMDTASEAVTDIESYVFDDMELVSVNE